LQRHTDLRVWSHPRPGYIFQVLSKSVQGFRSPGGQNLAFPITLDSRFYNSLYYNTNRDSLLPCWSLLFAMKANRKWSWSHINNNIIPFVYKMMGHWVELQQR